MTVAYEYFYNRKCYIQQRDCDIQPLGIKQFHRISNPDFDEEWDNSSAHDDDQTNHQMKIPSNYL